MIQLKEFCGMCRSYSWCGRPCLNAPKNYVVVDGAPAKVMAGITGIKLPSAKRNSAVSDDFDKTAYQRDYMRKKRADKKEATK